MIRWLINLINRKKYQPRKRMATLVEVHWGGKFNGVSSRRVEVLRPLSRGAVMYADKDGLLGFCLESQLDYETQAEPAGKEAR